MQKPKVRDITQHNYSKLSLSLPLTVCLIKNGNNNFDKSWFVFICLFTGRTWITERIKQPESGSGTNFGWLRYWHKLCSIRQLALTIASIDHFSNLQTMTSSMEISVILPSIIWIFKVDSRLVDYCWFHIWNNQIFHSIKETRRQKTNHERV